jgi:hypothetical protein
LYVGPQPIPAKALHYATQESLTAWRLALQTSGIESRLGSPTWPIYLQINVHHALLGLQSVFDTVLVDPPFGEVSSQLGIDHVDPISLFSVALTRSFQLVRSGGRVCSIFLDKWLTDARIDGIASHAYDVHRIEDTRLIVMCIRKTDALDYTSILGRADKMGL